MKDTVLVATAMRESGTRRHADGARSHAGGVRLRSDQVPGPRVGALVAGRTVQGFGPAVLGACALALVNDCYLDPGQRARARGL